MNQTNIKVDPDDKKMKLDRFMVKKIVIDIVQGDQFLYLSFRFDYKVSSRLLQCFSLCFPIPLSHCSPSLYISFFLFSFPSTCSLSWLILILVPSTPSPSLQVVVVRLKTTVQVSPHINAARELAAEYLMQWQQLSPQIFQRFFLFDVFAMLIYSH